jgi:hypothetical protein
MDDLVKELIEKAGLTQAQAEAAAKVVLEYMRHDDNRTKIAKLAALAATTAAVNVVVLPHAH